jgi:hypothetical protein
MPRNYKFNSELFQATGSVGDHNKYTQIKYHLFSSMAKYIVSTPKEWRSGIISCDAYPSMWLYMSSEVAVILIVGHVLNQFEIAE